jgi:hypothetical protein
LASPGSYGAREMPLTNPAPEPNAFGSVRTRRALRAGRRRLQSSLAERSDPKRMLNSGYGMEELDYATREASFEAKSGDEGRAGLGCRRSVSITSRGRIRSGHWAGGGYADDEEHHARARNYFRRRGNIRRQLGDVLRFREGKDASARVWDTACQRRVRRL